MNRRGSSRSFSAIAAGRPTEPVDGIGFLGVIVDRLGYQRTTAYRESRTLASHISHGETPVQAKPRLLF